MAVYVAVRSVAVRITVVVMVVMMAGRCRHVMIGAERSVRRERKRGHDRQSGREALGQQSDVTNHTSTDSRCVTEILIAAIVAV